MNYSEILIYNDLPIDSYWGEWSNVFLGHEYPEWIISKKISKTESMEMIRIQKGMYREGRVFPVKTNDKIRTYYGMSLIYAHHYMEKFVKKM